MYDLELFSHKNLSIAKMELKHAIKRGDLVTPNMQYGITALYLFKAPMQRLVGGDAVVDEVSSKEILTVVDIVRPKGRQRTTIQDEWKDGAVKLLSPRGIAGWVGVGWINPLPPPTKT